MNQLNKILHMVLSVIIYFVEYSSSCQSEWPLITFCSPYLKVCERSLSGSGAGPNAAAAAQFVRAEILPSGYLIRPCEGGGSIIHIVDHLNLEVCLPSIGCL